jgi:hypothetical protein
MMVEQIYFKTAKYGGPSGYDQHSTWTRLAAKWTGTSTYSIHATLGLQYFIEDKVPFSLRPPPVNQTPLVWSLTSLHEFHIDQHFGAFFEFGSLAFNYPNQYVHYGVSFFYEWMGGFAQLGFSHTLPVGENHLMPASNGRYYYENRSGGYTGGYYGHRVDTIHPEIQLQWVL